MIAVGYKKTLDPEDVPQLDRHDSVVEAFPVFRSKLEADGGVGSGVTTLKLLKALVWSAWKEILLTGFHALLYTMATYLGPYLIGISCSPSLGEVNLKTRGMFWFLLFWFETCGELLPDTLDISLAAGWN